MHQIFLHRVLGEISPQVTRQTITRAEVDENLFVEQPIGDHVIRNREGVPLVCKLRKGLYGTKQAARLWHQTLKNHIKKDGWTPWESDPCIYEKNTSEFGRQLMGIYVDDIIHLCNSEKARTHLHKYCNSKFPTTNAGRMDWFLRMRIKRDRKKRTLSLDQNRALHEILTDHGFTDDTNVAKLPMQPDWIYDELTSKQLTPEEATQFRSSLGRIAYITNCTRPDMAIAVNILCRYMSKPNQNCATAMEHLLRYLNGTRNLGIKYTTNAAKSLRLECFVDASYIGADDEETQMKSTSGFVCMLGGAPVSWGSHLQRTISTSSAEAELVSAFEASRNVVYHRNFLQELGLHMAGRTVMWEDNTACEAMSRNPVNHKRCKHIKLKYFYLRDLVESGILGLEFISTVDQVADLFTKPVKLDIFQRLRPSIVTEIDD